MEKQRTQYRNAKKCILKAKMCAVQVIKFVERAFTLLEEFDFRPIHSRIRRSNIVSYPRPVNRSKATNSRKRTFTQTVNSSGDGIASSSSLPNNSGKTSRGKKLLSSHTLSTDSVHKPSKKKQKSTVREHSKEQSIQRVITSDDASQEETLMTEKATFLSQLNVSEKECEEIEDDSTDHQLKKSVENSSLKRTFKKKGSRKPIQKKVSDGKSETEEPTFAAASVKLLRRQRKSGCQEKSSVDKSENEEFVFGNPTSANSVKRYVQMESGSQSETENAATRNGGKQSEEGSSNQSFKMYFKDAKRKRILQNNGERKNNREESRSAVTSAKSVRRQGRSCRQVSTADESQEKELVPETSASVKKRKMRKQEISYQNEPKNYVNKDIGMSRKTRGRRIIPNEKTQCKPFSIVCRDILEDPAFASHPFIIEYKTNNVSNSCSTRDDDSAIDEFKIIDGADKDQDSLKNPENEDEALLKNPGSEDETVDTEDVKDSPEQAPSCKSVSSDPAEPENAASSNSASFSGRNCRQGALSTDASKGETSFKQVVISESNVVHSELNSSDNSDVDQEDKSERKSNEVEVGISESREKESNAKDTKAIDADPENEQESQSLVENINAEASNMVHLSDAETNSDLNEDGKLTEETDELKSEGNHCGSSPAEVAPDSVDNKNKMPARPPGLPPDSHDEDWYDI